MKDPIVYVGVSESEKVFKALALPLASAFTAALKDLAQKNPFSSCVRIEKTSLPALLKSSPLTACALDIRYRTGVLGNALLVSRSDSLVSLGELLSGTEAKIADTLNPELMEVCIRFFSLAVNECNRQFSLQYFAIASDEPELLNPDGMAAGLAPLNATYDSVLCATYEVSVEPKLDCRFYLLIEPQLLESLSMMLPDYNPNPPLQSATEQRIAARKQKKEEPVTYVAAEVEGDQPRIGKTSNDNWNIDLLLDVELPIAVSFGECEMPLKDILKLAAGSVIELDKSVNDPVTVIVNQKPIAKGEVVMVDGNYGVRIVEVESTADRIRSLA